MLAERIGRVRQAAGPRFDQIELSAFLSLELASSRGRAAERFARVRGWTGIDPAQVSEMPTAFLGSVEDVVEQLVERRELYGLSYYIVPGQRLEEVTPIVARTAGT